MLLTSVGLAGAALTLPGTLELAALTLGAILPSASRRDGSVERRGDPSTCGQLAVVVPAHDEESGIADCVRSLLACDAPPNGARVVVVADNCTDATAARAAEAGAEVLVRDDDARRGKGYALELAFDHVLQDPAVDAVLVVDADTRVSQNFLSAMAATFAAGADGAQCRYLIGNPESSRRARLMNVAVFAFNIARPRARERYGLSVGILGNGFGLHRRVLEALPYTARSVVEDLEYHLMMVRAGFAVRFVEETAVTADAPVTVVGQETQRARWEGGRFEMIREHAPRLLRDVLGGRGDLVEPLGELLLLPLATHVGALVLVALVPFPPTQLYAAGALGLVAAHVAIALKVGGAGVEDVAALASVPYYVVKKAVTLPTLLRAVKRGQNWVRTERA